MMRPVEREERCRRHPKHKQSMGVCPYCLKEKLYQLSASSSANGSSSTSTSGSSLSSPAASSSPPPPPPHHGELNSKKVPVLYTKSRSLASILGEQVEEERKMKKKKKGRFWSKLMVVGSRRREEDGGGLLHSKTVKEKGSSTRWVLFS